MVSSRGQSTRRSVRRIAINGRNLDEVLTHADSPHAPGAKALIGFPVERHTAVEDDAGITLRLPALVVLQLLYDGTLPQDRAQAVSVTLAAKSHKQLYLQGFTVPSDLGRHETVLLRFASEPPAVEARYDPRAWLAGLKPLRLYPRGHWDPTEEFWGDPGVPIGAWAKPIIKRGPRPMFEMEQVLPGYDPGDPDGDPIVQANDLKYSGKIARARKLLERLLIKDVRCLDAHAHLGNLVFDNDPRRAFDHYQRGTMIGELSLADRFDGVLPWGLIDNRPFLRCLNGMGLCLWRMDRFEEAGTLFERMLWMCPSDNLGIRFLLPDVQAGKSWAEATQP